MLTDHAVTAMSAIQPLPFTATLKNVASGRLVVAAGAQKALCMWKYMSISSTAGHRQPLAQ